MSRRGCPLRGWDGTNTTSYVYDTQNQLVRENNPAAGKTWTWVYDNGGNILSRNEYAYTTGTLGTPVDTVSYTYGDSSWGDLLTAYDGKPITYDTIGNPLTYDGWTFNWQHGRQLASMSKDGTTWTNTYDANGMRIKRTDGTTTYQYVYNGSSLSQMTVGGNTLRFAYDVGGIPMSVTYNGTAYYYAVNLQGDVIAILNASGTAVVEYTYDAWGNILTATGTMASTLGTHNPLRYRGYVYDTETGLYYLQSRYYNPDWGRFINADAFASTGQGMVSMNMFAYCGNNPVSRNDESGEFFGELATIIAVAVVIAATIRDIVQLTRSDEKRVEAVVNTNDTTKKKTVQIRNSHRIKTPWVRLGYSAYINHSGETKDVIKGTSVGVAYEWTVHNVGYEVASVASTVLEIVGVDNSVTDEIIERCDPVDLGATLFHDTGAFLSGRWFASEAMKAGYALTSPMAAIVDYVIKIFD